MLANRKRPVEYTESRAGGSLWRKTLAGVPRFHAGIFLIVFFALLREGNYWLRIVHKLLNFAKSSERAQAKMPSTQVAKYIAIR